MANFRQALMKAFLAFSAIAALGAGALGQELSDKAPRPAIRVSGEATVTTRPDQAQIDIGVMTQAQVAESAATQNAQRLDAVLREMRNILGSDADIKTINYSISPNYIYPKEGGQPKINGYTASNIVQVKVNDLALVGKVIDAATKSGSNNIHALRFGLKDEQAARAQALREATARAKAKAEAIASALGVKIVRVLLAEEGGGFPIPLQGREFAQVDKLAVQTPIEPGTLDIRAIVTITFEVQ
jgi:uncharacterized protein